MAGANNCKKDQGNITQRDLAVRQVLNEKCFDVVGILTNYCAIAVCRDANSGSREDLSH